MNNKYSSYGIKCEVCGNYKKSLKDGVCKKCRKKIKKRKNKIKGWVEIFNKIEEEKNEKN